mmetsp:Transcript_16848/g.36254  ORF Transcript_16848/g.36254 Transcript_16848/m.36254 type:complete len:921 (-) Transcript_16848:113-2875(-)
MSRIVELIVSPENFEKDDDAARTVPNTWSRNGSRLLLLRSDRCCVQRPLGPGVILPIRLQKSPAPLQFAPAEHGIVATLLSRVAQGYVLFKLPGHGDGLAEMAPQCHRLFLGPHAFCDLELRCSSFQQFDHVPGGAAFSGGQGKSSAALLKPPLPPPRAGSASIRHYLEQTGVQQSIQAALRIAAHVRPADPYKFVARLLSRGFDCKADQEEASRKLACVDQGARNPRATSLQDQQPQGEGCFTEEDDDVVEDVEEMIEEHVLELEPAGEVTLDQTSKSEDPRADNNTTSNKHYHDHESHDSSHDKTNSNDNDNHNNHNHADEAVLDGGQSQEHEDRRLEPESVHQAEPSAASRYAATVEVRMLSSSGIEDGMVLAMRLGNRRRHRTWFGSRLPVMALPLDTTTPQKDHFLKFDLCRHTGSCEVRLPPSAENPASAGAASENAQEQEPEQMQEQEELKTAAVQAGGAGDLTIVPNLASQHQDSPPVNLRFGRRLLRVMLRDRQSDSDSSTGAKMDTEDQPPHLKLLDLLTPEESPPKPDLQLEYLTAVGLLDMSKGIIELLSDTQPDDPLAVAASIFRSNGGTALWEGSDKEEADLPDSILDSFSCGASQGDGERAAAISWCLDGDASERPPGADGVGNDTACADFGGSGHVEPGGIDQDQHQVGFGEELDDAAFDQRRHTTGSGPMLLLDYQRLLERAKAEAAEQQASMEAELREAFAAEMAELQSRCAEELLAEQQCASELSSKLQQEESSCSELRSLCEEQRLHLARSEDAAAESAAEQSRRQAGLESERQDLLKTVESLSGHIEDQADSLSKLRAETASLRQQLEKKDTELLMHQAAAVSRRLQREQESMTSLPTLSRTKEGMPGHMQDLTKYERRDKLAMLHGKIRYMDEVLQIAETRPRGTGASFYVAFDASCK